MAKFAKITDAKGGFEGDQKAFMVDGFATMIGAVLGTSPVTTYIESAPGIEAGGRTGLTAVWGGFLFFLSVFFAPLLASVPPWATGPALIVVGAPTPPKNSKSLTRCYDGARHRRHQLPYPKP